MSFISDYEGTVYAPGWFLASEKGVVRKTVQLPNSNGETITTEDGREYVPMGSGYNDGAGTYGIVYEDVDVTNGDAPGSIVLNGAVYTDRLTETGVTVFDISDTGRYLQFDQAPEVTRPY